MKIVGRWNGNNKAGALNSALTVLLVCLIGMSFPSEWLEKLIGKMEAMLTIRYIFAAAGIVLIFLYGFHAQFKFTKAAALSIPAVILAVLLALSNFPYLSLAGGKAEYIAGQGATAAYVFLCLSIGLFEEIFFRGLILPLLFVRFKDHKYGALIAIVSNSVLFGLVHLINLFGGASVGAVMLQIGYSTLIGAVCACLYYFSQSIWFSVLFHTLFDVGGLLLDFSIIRGSIWSVPEIIVMAALGTITAAVFLLLFLRKTRRAETPPVHGTDTTC